jgi:NADH-quinone oxidoreductase subunit F
MVPSSFPSMATTARVLPPKPVTTLDGYVAGGGGRGIEAARKLGPAAVIEHVEAAGLRGRGGAGFPTGRKWRTVAENRSPAVPTSVVVNGAEGEPGSFKDRAILRANPYHVLEGALVAAMAVNADSVVVALKASFDRELERLRTAVEEVRAAGWADVELAVFEGPSEYLYGEETALLEVIDGREPFPRIAPPFRHGMDEMTEDDDASAAQVELAVPGDTTAAPPTLVNNVETLANVPSILARGPDWFRELGTDASPGSIVCTVTGRTRRHGVGEVAMGMPLRDVIDEIGGGARPGRRVVAVMSGVAHPLVPESRLDTPIGYETMQEIGAGLGAAGFIVFDDETDLVAVAQGVSRFLAVESCGQCTPCKQDGLALADALDRLRRSEANAYDLGEIDERLRTVTDSARCFLAHQHQRVVESVFRLFPEAVKAHAEGGVEAVESELIAPIVALSGGEAVLDARQRDKQPDWTYDEVWSGQSPADRVESRAAEPD